MEVKDIAFENRSQDRDFNLYTEEFLGGADTFIYINGNRVNDVSAIQYSVREQKKPIFGYSSRIFDDIALGSRVVQGLIKIPIRNTSIHENIAVTTTTTHPTIRTAPNWVYGTTVSGDTSSEISYEDEIDDIKTRKNNSSYRQVIICD